MKDEDDNTKLTFIEKIKNIMTADLCRDSVIQKVHKCVKLLAAAWALSAIFIVLISVSIILAAVSPWIFIWAFVLGGVIVGAWVLFDN